MLENAVKDVQFVVDKFQSAGLCVSVCPFGSTAKGRSGSQSDIDVAVVVSGAKKDMAATLLRELGGTPERMTNWKIDIFDSRDESFGYNSRSRGTLHFLIMSQQEYEGDSALAENIRSTAINNRS